MFPFRVSPFFFLDLVSLVAFLRLSVVDRLISVSFSLNATSISLSFKRKQMQKLSRRPGRKVAEIKEVLKGNVIIESNLSS